MHLFGVPAAISGLILRRQIAHPAHLSCTFGCYQPVTAKSVRFLIKWTQFVTLEGRKSEFCELEQRRRKNGAFLCLISRIVLFPFLSRSASGLPCSVSRGIRTKNEKRKEVIFVDALVQKLCFTRVIRFQTCMKFTRRFSRLGVKLPTQDATNIIVRIKMLLNR